MTKLRLCAVLGVLAVLLVTSPRTDALFSGTTSTSASLSTAAYTPPACVEPEVMADNPVGYWRMNETSGTSAADISGNNNTGTYTGGYTLNQTNTPLGDPANRSVALSNASTGYVNVPNSPSLQIGDNFTYEAWVRLAGQNTNNEYRTVMWKGTGAYLGFSNTGALELWSLNGGGTRIAYTYTTVTDTKWHHVAVTKNGANYALWIDGIPGSTQLNAPVTMLNNTSPLQIGQRTSQGLFGNIDEAAVYNTALSVTRIQAHFNAGRCYRDEPRADSATSIWRMGEVTNDPEAFDSQSSNHGGYTNGPTLNSTSLLDFDSANKAVNFDGVDDRINVADAANLKMTGNMTLEVWIKPTALPSAGSPWIRIIGKGGGTNRNYGLWMTNAGAVHYNQCTAGCAQYLNTQSPDGTIVAGNTYHIVGTTSGATRTLYVNGAQVAQTTTAGTVATSTDPLVLGVTDEIPWTAHFKGTIDEAALYSGALSATRVNDHYVAGRSYRNIILDAGATAFWRLGDNTGTTAADELGTTNGTRASAFPYGYGAVAGDPNPSSFFDGTATYRITGPNTTAIQSNTGTVEAWIWTADTSAGYHTIFEKYAVVGLYINTGRLWAAAGVSGVMDSGVSVATSRWMHVAITFQNGVTNGTKLYVNGVQAGAAGTLSYNDQNYGMGIGGSLANVNYALAVIDEVAYYKRVLSAGELLNHYNAGLKQPR